MRYLNKVIFLNSAHVPYAEIKLDGNVHFIGTQGVGKSTLLRAILFFYNADKLRLGIPKEKKNFDSFYLPYDNSYIVYEVMRENGAYSVMVTKSMKRAAFRFIDAPYSREWFINDRNEVVADWTEIRKRIPTGCSISPIVNDYYVFRDIIFGNNRNSELVSYRKYAIVESPNYQNIPRTIQNVFLNSKLDADFIKDTIIKSMSEEEISIDLNVYRSLVSSFEQEYKDVMLWLKPNKNGVVEVRKQADDLIKRYRQLLYQKQKIQQDRAELNYAEKAAMYYLPMLQEDIKGLQDELDTLVRLLSEESEKFDKERIKLTREVAVYDEKLKMSKQKRAEYEKLNIQGIIERINKEQDIILESESAKKVLAEMTSKYDDIIKKYDSLIRQLRADFKDFEALKKEEILNLKEHFAEEKEVLSSNLYKHQQELRDRYEGKREHLEDEKLSLVKEIEELKGKKKTTRADVHYKKEIDACTSAVEQIQKEEAQMTFNIKSRKLECEQLRQNAANDIKQVEWDYKEQLARVASQRDLIDEEIKSLNLLLNQQRGSFCEWLEKNKPNWQLTIGKVVDEESVLYNQHLKPQLVANGGSDLFGVKLDLSEVSSELRTPSMIKEEVEGKAQKRARLVAQIETLSNECQTKCDSIQKSASKKIRQLSDEQHLWEAQRDQIPTTLKSLKADLLSWQHKDEEWKSQKTERLDLLLGECEIKQRDLNGRLESLKAELQKGLKHLENESNKVVAAKEKTRDEAIKRLNEQVNLRRTEKETRETALYQSQTKELKGEGADTTVITAYQQKSKNLDEELVYIRINRHFVIEYNKDKSEYFDSEADFQQCKHEATKRYDDLKTKYKARSEKLKKSKKQVDDALKDKNQELATIQKELDDLAKFRGDSYFSPVESVVLEERPTKRSCGELLEELKLLIIKENKENDDFKKVVNAFSSNFTSKNTFGFPTSLSSDADFFNYASNICEFVEEDKILVYQTRISERYSNIIMRIAREVGELMKNEGEIHKTIKAINNDFVERNFAGVIRSIELRQQESNDKLMQLLLEIKEFNENNQLNLGEVNLFSQESRTAVNEKAVKYLNAFSNRLNDELSRKWLVLSDTFNLQFRIIENDNDTGWIEKIANVGSDGTDILVKAMVNIMLINVFKEKASRKFGDFKIHCMMDEIGKLHPTNVKGILSFANCRNILLINSSPTTYNVEDYRYTYLLSKDAKSNTKVVPLLTRKK